MERWTLSVGYGGLLDCSDSLCFSRLTHPTTKPNFSYATTLAALQNWGVENGFGVEDNAAGFPEIAGDVGFEFGGEKTVGGLEEGGIVGGDFVNGLYHNPK